MVLDLLDICFDVFIACFRLTVYHQAHELVAGAWDVLLSFRGAAMWNLTEKRHEGYRPFAHQHVHKTILAWGLVNKYGCMCGPPRAGVID